MKFLTLLSLAVFLTAAPAGFAQSRTAPTGGKVQRLPKAETAKTISLNPDYYVHGLEFAKKKEKLPLLIILRGGGGTGLNIEKSKRGAHNVIRTIAKTDIKTLVVAPQASKSPRDEGAKGGWVRADLDVLLAHLIKTLPTNRGEMILKAIKQAGGGKQSEVIVLKGVGHNAGQKPYSDPDFLR